MDNKRLKCSGFPDVRHVECGGELAITGTATLRMPVGFGFDADDAKGGFVVDSLEYKAYTGFCMKCHAEGDFVRVDQKARLVRKRPRSINRKLRAAAGGAR